MNFLIKKFCGRVISCQSPLGHNWPPYSPDLNPLDSFVWGFIEGRVRRIQPESIPELQQAAEDIAATILMEMLRNASQNVRKCANARIKASGGHLENFLQLM